MQKNKTSYLILSFISLVLFLFTLQKANSEIKRFLLPLFLALSGLNFIAEYFILVIGRGYSYYPRVFKNPYFDNVLGSSVSQLFVVPTTGLLISIFNLNYRWILLITLIITGIEKLFVKLKVYKHHWWSIYLTIIGLQLFYSLAKFWRRQLIKKENKLVRFCTLLLSIFVTHATLTFYHVSLLKTFLFKISWFKNIYRSHIAVATIYTGFSSLVFFYSILIKRAYANFWGVMFVLGVELFLIKCKLLTVSSNLYYIVSPLTKFLTIWMGVYIYRILFLTK